MQPTIICSAPAPGVVYVNGRFAGEASRERPLFAPISPCGAVYLEYRPLDGRGGLARKLVLSGGAPMDGSLADGEGVWCVAWPGGALEVEFALPRPSTECFLLEGMACALTRGEETTLALNGLVVSLPEGARRPALIRLDGAAALVGDIDGGGQYLAALNADMTAQAGLLTAARIDVPDGGLVSAIVDLGDSVGHGRLEQWLVDANGLSRVSAQSVWSAGAPRWPTTAEGAMIAAVEAMLAGQEDEAAGYMSPALAATSPLGAIDAICDVCVPMKYAPPDPRPCVGLVRAVNDHLAAVRPLYYAAAPCGGPQGAWQIEKIGLS